MRIRPFQAVYPNFDYVTSADAFFDRVKYEYPAYKKSGFFNKAAQEAIYIYRIEGANRSYTGLIACADIQDYFDGRIKKHENTLAAKEQQQMQLMLRRNAMVKPILLTYPNVKKISQLINRFVKKNPVFYETVFAEDQARHIFWEVTDGALIQQFQDLFLEKIPGTYIADGHHRSSTFGLMHQRMGQQKDHPNYDYMLCAFFPSDELEIHDFNRVVEGLDDITLVHFMTQLSQVFDMETLDTPRKPKEKFEIIMFLKRECLSLRWKPAILKAYKKDKVILDANLLNEEVIDKIIGIKDTRADVRIKYIEGKKGLDAVRIRANKGDNRVGFCLYPVALDDLITIADMGKTMPPKSTYFEPRIKNGLIVQEF